MKKLNKIIYNKLLLQAQEAKDNGFKKLANNIFETIGSVPEDEDVKYSYSELKSDIEIGLWKIASNIMKYYDLDSIDAQKLDSTIEVLAENFVEEIEKTLDIEPTTIGPLEDKVLGQK